MRAESLRWLVTGATGMVGTEAVGLLRKRNVDLIAVGRAELDITDRDAVFYLLDLVQPNVVLNCAAYTKVDACEEQEDLAYSVNATGVRHLAEASDETDSLLVHISTDFVFDGSKSGAWEIDDEPRPLSAYGRSKLEGEQQASTASRNVVVRTSWVFGNHGWNFVEAILKQLEDGKRHLRVVHDQQGCPTWTPHLASALIDLGESAFGREDARGLFHYSDKPSCTWFDFAKAIASSWKAHAQIQDEIEIEPVTTDAFPRPAVRPPNSVLSTSRYEAITGNTPGNWQDGLKEYLELRSLDSDPSV